MIKHRWREIAKSFIDPEKAEQLRRSKNEVEHDVTRILKLLSGGDQVKTDETAKDSGKQSELVWLVEDFYKHYLSLDALYNHLRGETGNLLHSRKEKEDASLYTSSSDSDYFSSEEIEGSLSNLDNELPAVTNSSNKVRETSNFKIVSSGGKKGVNKGENRREGTNSKDSSVGVSEREGGVSAAGKIHDVQVNKVSEKIIELENQINVFRIELECLRCQRRELEAWVETKASATKQLVQNALEDELQKVVVERNEALAELEGLRDQVKVLHEELETLSNQKTDTQKRADRENSANWTAVKSMKKELARKTTVERRLLVEKEGLLLQTKELQTEADSLRDHRTKLEEQFKKEIHKIDNLRVENEGLHARNSELEKALSQREDELASIKRKYENEESVAFMEIVVFGEQIKNMKLEFDSLEERRNWSELQKECEKQELEIELIMLRSKIADQQRTFREQEQTIEKLSEENKQAQKFSLPASLNLQFVDRKMEELAAGFRKNLEGSIRLLSRRILVAEQLHAETREICRMRDAKLGEENTALKQKIAAYNSVRSKSTNLSAKVDNALNALDLLGRKFEEDSGNLLDQISRMPSELLHAKTWVKERKTELIRLNQQLEDKEEQEFLLRENIWKLEAKVSKEGGERLNLIQAVSQLEKRIEKSEKMIEEKDDDLLRLAEEKREAIRQLCVLVDYHRCRCDDLKQVISKLTVNSRKKRT